VNHLGFEAIYNWANNRFEGHVLTKEITHQEIMVAILDMAYAGAMLEKKIEEIEKRLEPLELSRKVGFLF
jgi:hypothetical protein